MDPGELAPPERPPDPRPRPASVDELAVGDDAGLLLDLIRELCGEDPRECWVVGHR